MSVPSIINCSCCKEPINLSESEELWEEGGIGPVCAPCKYNLKCAVAYLKHHQITPCVQGPESRFLE